MPTDVTTQHPMLVTEMSTETFDAGQRVQLHPGTDAWMQGDRYGEVVRTQRNRLVVVKMDRSGRNLRCPPELLTKID